MNEQLTAQEQSITTIFPAELCFAGTINAPQIAETLLENYSAVEAYVIAKKWGEIFSGEGSGKTRKQGATDILKERAMASIDGTESDVLLAGRTIATASLANTAAEWDYNGDCELERIDKEIEALKEKRKLRCAFLQTLPSELVDPKTGEVSTPAKKLSQGSTIKIKHKK